MEYSVQHQHKLSDEVKKAIQMEMNFIHRVLLGQQNNKNLKAIEAMGQNKNFNSQNPMKEIGGGRPSSGGIGNEADKCMEDKMEKNVNSVKRRLNQPFTKCIICERPSMYRYYGVKCCESCKQFFRRSVVKQVLFKCRRQNCCQINEDAIKCHGCRLDKCLLAGMEPTMINAAQSVEFAHFMASLEQRKRIAQLRMNFVHHLPARGDRFLALGTNVEKHIVKFE